MAPVRSRGKGPPPPPPFTPRLAYMRRRAPSRGQPRELGSALTGFLVMGGATVATAAWIGGALFDTKDAISRGLDGLAASAGLRASIEVRGASGAREAQIASAALPTGRVSILAASPEGVKHNVESLDWVEHAKVQRLWPSTIVIDVRRREGVALWRDQGALAVVDAAGERVHGARAADYPGLPVLAGAGAGPAAGPMLSALEGLPQISARLRLMERVGERRWDVHLKNSVVLSLPETNPEAALKRAAALAPELLDGRYQRLDLRAPGFVAALPRAPQTANAPKSEAQGQGA